MSDVTAEEIAAEMGRADMLRHSLALDVIEPDRTAIATALAIRAREARREALEAAAKKADNADCEGGECCSCSIYAAGAIRALMEPGK